MNKLANLKAQIYREKRRLLRLTLFRKNRAKDHKFIEKSTHPNPKATLQFNKNPVSNPQINLSNAHSNPFFPKIKITKPKPNKPAKSRLEINKEDIRILLNEMYLEESNEFLLILSIKLANVLIQLSKDGLLDQIKKDGDFMEILKAQLFSENFICFLSQPFSKSFVAHNQLRCLETFTSLFDFADFFNSRGFLLRRLIANLLQKYNSSDHVLLKLRILHNSKCFELKRSLALVVEETLSLLTRSFQAISPTCASLDFDVYRTTSQVVFELVSLWESLHCSSSQLADSAPLLDEEIESVLLAISSLIEHVLEFLEMAFANHLEHFRYFYAKSASKPQPLVFLFSFLYRLVDLDADRSSLVDFSRCFVKYLDVADLLVKDFIYFEDGFKEFVLLLNSLVVRQREAEDCRFNFEVFHLKHGPQFFKCFKRCQISELIDRKFLASQAKDEIIAFFWLCTNLLSLDCSHFYYNIIRDAPILSKSLDLMLCENDLHIDTCFADFFYNFVRRADPSNPRLTSDDFLDLDLHALTQVVYEKVHFHHQTKPKLATDFLEIITDIVKILFQSQEDFSSVLGKSTFPLTGETIKDSVENTQLAEWVHGEGVISEDERLAQASGDLCDLLGLN